MPNDFSQTSDDSLVQRIVEILRRRMLLAIAVFAIVGAAAVAFALYLPDLYRATALVLVERPMSESVVRTPVIGEVESRLYVIKQEILSRDRLIELIDRFDLYPELRRRSSLQDVLTQARNDIAVEPAGPEQVSGRYKTVSFILSYTGDRRETVADVTNAVAAFFVQQNDRMRSEEAIRTTQFLREQLAQAKRELDRHDSTMRDFTSRYTGELPQQVGVNLASLERLNTQLRLNGEQQIRLIEQRDRLFDGLRDTPAVARAASSGEMTPELLERLRQIDDLKQKLALAELEFTNRHPDVLKLREQLAAMERDQAVAEAAAAERARQEAATASASAATPGGSENPLLRRRTIENVDAELAKLRKDESDIRLTIAGFERRLETSPQREQDYMLVTRDYAAAKDQYDSLLKRVDEAQLTESMEQGRAGERFRVLDAAVAPEGPTAPNRMRLLLMGLLLALAAAVGAVLLREQFDTAFHTVDEVRYTAVPVLVSIPPIGPKPWGRRVKTAFAAACALGAVALAATTAAYLAQGNAQLVRLIAF